MFDGILAGARSLPFIVAPIAEQMVREGDDGWGRGAWFVMSLMMVLF